MADKKTEEVKTVTEATYSVVEFAESAKKTFGEKANADLVRAAFAVEGKTSATLSEAKGIVSKFMSKEVK